MTTYQREVYRAAYFAACGLSGCLERQVSGMMDKYPTLTRGKLERDMGALLRAGKGM